MKYLNKTLTVSFVFILAACGKDNGIGSPSAGIQKNSKGIDSPPGVIPKIQSDGYATYFYDKDGRRTEMTDPGGSRTLYTYSGSTVTEKYYGSSGNLISGKVHELNGRGFVIKTTRDATPGTRTYRYNAAGQLINDHFVGASFSDNTDDFYFYSAQGRLDSMIASRNSNSVVVSRTFYEYGIDKPNTISNINMGLLHLGNPFSDRPPTKVTIIYSGMNPLVDNISYTYDNLNRISQTSFNGGPGVGYSYY